MSYAFKKAEPSYSSTYNTGMPTRVVQWRLEQTGMSPQY
jgi:hypothetical protein